MRLAATIAALALLAALPLAGCGDSSPSGETGGSTTPRERGPAGPEGARTKPCPSAAGAEAIHVTGASCPQARLLAAVWRRRAGCAPASGASRSSCSIATYRCLTAATGRGLSVSCSQPGHSIGFTLPRSGGG
jgi:hypothetical protein